MFNNDTIRSLFAMFIGEEYDEKFDPFVELAKDMICEQLDDRSFMSEAPVQFLCAALANYHVQLMRCSSDGGRYVYAGRLDDPSQQYRLEYAKQLLSEYQTICRRFLKVGFPLFTAFSGKEDIV